MIEKIVFPWGAGRSWLKGVSHDLDIMDLYDDLSLSFNLKLVRNLFVGLLALGLWAYLGKIDEVTKGEGKVVPSSREQVIQSLEGGILVDLNVSEGDTIKQGEILAQLDPKKNEFNVEESASKYRSVLASSIRLAAEVDGADLNFPESLRSYPEIITSETRLYRERKKQLEDSLAGIEETLGIVGRELQITEALMKTGAASRVEVLRLQRQRSELLLKKTDIYSAYMVRAREELSKALSEIKTLSSVIEGRKDSLKRLTIRSPVNGIVKDIEVTTIGGVIPPNGKLMRIVPLDKSLIIEARISPRDIAFIHPGQPAQVKITAYDYSIYGGLHGTVSTISPDTIQDKVKPELYYYRVFIRTDTHFLKNKAGKRFPIYPGMISTVDIKTGEKTVFEYMVKPFNRLNEALRER